jgi:hypothetical protein
MINTKWPRLLVVGESVTEEQADEILIRTNGWWWIGGNDGAFSEAVEDVAAEFGYPPEPDLTAPTEQRTGRWKNLQEWRKSLGILELEYLTNDRIQSSWIGGPHGWCDWDGSIGCSTHNIGKWPSAEDVTEEWQRIAEAFPYLDLTAQCVEDEGEGRIADEWRVVNGSVTHTDEPPQQLRTIREAPFIALFSSAYERGVTVERLRQAFQTTVARRESSG